MPKLKCLPLLATLLLMGGRAFAQEAVYWSSYQNQSILRMQPTDGRVDTVASSVLNRPEDVLIDPVEDRLFWTSNWGQRIMTIRLDGSEMRSIHEGRLVGMDFDHGRLFVLRDSTLWSADTEGLNERLEYVFPLRVMRVVVDPLTRKAYWSHLDATTSMIQVYVSRLDVPGDAVFIWEKGLWGEPLLFLEPDGSRLRLSETEVFNTDGSGLETVDRMNLAMAVDTVAGRTYWLEDGPYYSGPYAIWSSDRNGAMPELIAELEQPALGMAVDPVRDLLVWTSDTGLWRARLNGSDVQPIVESPMSMPGDIAVDQNGGFVYWVSGKRVGRTRIDGSATEILISNEGKWVRGIAVDESEGRIYWVVTDAYSYPGPQMSRIRRARLDGSEVETVVTMGATFLSVDVDPYSGLVYWSQEGGRIYEVESTAASERLIWESEEQGSTMPVLVDGTKSLLYWTHDRFISGTGLTSQVYRSGLAGTDVVLLVECTDPASIQDCPQLLAVGPATGSLYWMQGTSLWVSTDGWSDRRLLATDLTSVGRLSVVESSGVANEIPSPAAHGFRLFQPFPNPAPVSTNVSFELSSAGDATIRLYDAIGREVNVHHFGRQPAGARTHKLDTADLVSGSYFVVLDVGGLRRSVGISVAH